MASRYWYTGERSEPPQEGYSEPGEGGEEKKKQEEPQKNEKQGREWRLIWLACLIFVFFFFAMIRFSK